MTISMGDDSTLTISGSLPAGTNLIGGVKVIDTAGTNAATVKAASTAPVATDTALVTSESQNSPLLVAPGSVYGTQPGPLCGAVATTAAPSYTSGQINPLSQSTAGNLRTLLATTQVAIPLWGHGATGAAVPANVVYNGAIATTANPTNATAGNSVGLMADKAGRLVTTPHHIRENVATAYLALSASSETTLIAAVASTFNDICQLIISTAGAAAATITIRDGTAGTILMVLDYPDAALASADGPLVINFDPPISQAAVNTNWTVQNSVTTLTHITARYIVNK